MATKKILKANSLVLSPLLTFLFCDQVSFSDLLSASMSQKHKKQKKPKKNSNHWEIKTQFKWDNVCFLGNEWNLLFFFFFCQNSTHRALKKKSELYDLTPLQYLLTVWAVVQVSGFHAVCLVRRWTYIRQN